MNFDRPKFRSTSYKYLGNKKVAQDFAMSEFSLILVLQNKTLI